MAVQKIMGQEASTKIEKGIQIINVFGTWCGPCKMFAPILEEISENFETFKINIDDNPEYVKEMNIKGVPSTFIFKDGQLKDTIVGFIPKEIMETKIEAIK